MKVTMKAASECTVEELITFMTETASDDFGMTRKQLETKARKQWKDSVVEQLREAGYLKVPILSAETALAHDESIIRDYEEARDPENRRHTPEEWRWFLIRLQRETDAEGKILSQSAPVAINGREINLVRGRNIWVGEGYVEHLEQCTEDHYEQDDPHSPVLSHHDGSGVIPEMRCETVQRYPFTIQKVGGLIKDGPPPAKGSELIYMGFGVECEEECIDLMRRNGVEMTGGAGLFVNAA